MAQPGAPDDAVRRPRRRDRPRRPSGCRGRSVDTDRRRAPPGGGAPRVGAGRRAGAVDRELRRAHAAPADARRRAAAVAGARARARRDRDRRRPRPRRHGLAGQAAQGRDGRAADRRGAAALRGRQGDLRPALRRLPPAGRPRPRRARAGGRRIALRDRAGGHHGAHRDPRQGRQDDDAAARHACPTPRSPPCSLSCADRSATPRRLSTSPWCARCAAPRSAASDRGPRPS